MEILNALGLFAVGMTAKFICLVSLLAAILVTVLVIKKFPRTVGWMMIFVICQKIAILALKGAELINGHEAAISITSVIVAIIVFFAAFICDVNRWK